MKRKTTALLPALIMCLALLSARGGDNTLETSVSPSSESTAQSAINEKNEDERLIQEQEQEESVAPTPEESENKTGMEFLALLQDEWNNEFFEGEGPKPTYYLGNSHEHMAFISDGVVYIYGVNGHDDNSFYSYDIAIKECKKSMSIDLDLDVGSTWPGFSIFFMDNNLYVASDSLERSNSDNLEKYDFNGVLLSSFQLDYDDSYLFDKFLFFEKGILAIREGYDNYASSVVLLSHNLEKVADIPAPQYEIEHGLKEDYKMYSDYIFVTDGTVYTKFFRDYNTHYLYRLNIDTCEWENLVEHNVAYENCFDFFGKYFLYNDGIYDRVTGEQVFECGGLYCPANSYEADTLCYFGGNKYLGRKGDEYRWVNLTDMSMSDPLPFPEGEIVTVLDDTYCVYRDKYGWFLWNYNTGEEETILAFDN